MRCRDLEEYISIGLSLFDSLRERARSVQEYIARGAMEYDVDISKSFLEGYREWLKPCAAVESTMCWFESRNYQVAKANEFRAAVREISLHEFDIDKLIQAENDIRSGRGKTLAEAIHELQGHRCA